MKLLLICLLATSACSGLDTGNAGTIEFGLTIEGSEPLVDSGGNAFTLSSAVATVRDFEFYLPDGVGCGDVADCEAGKVRARGNFTIDLLESSIAGDVRVPAGTYRRVDVRFDDDTSDVTLRMAGLVVIDGTITPFRLSLDFSETARFEGVDGVRVREGDVTELILRFDPSAWLASAPIVQCARDGDLDYDGDTLIIEDGGGGCSDIEAAIRDAIEASGEPY